MKNFFTGTLAFIVYAGLCLAVFGYFFIGRLSVDDTNLVDHNIIEEEPIIDELIAIEIDSTPSTNTTLDQQLDSIAAAKALTNSILTSEDSLIPIDNNIIDTDTVQHDLNDESNMALNNKETTVYEANTFIITDQHGNQLTNCTTFTTIYKNNPKVKIPYPCRAYGNELKEIINTNPKAQIIINGYASSTEDADMGMRRAQYVKRLLTNIGVNDNQITLKSAMKDIPFKSGIAQGGIDIQVLNINENSSISNSTKSTIGTAARPSVTAGSGPYAYQRFTKGYQGDFFYGNRAFTAYIKDIENFLSENPSKKVYVYAYTDTVGNATDNFNIGKDNVNTARRLMIQNGITSNRIVSISKGEESSGATGNNRSIVVIVK
ncbi:MAG: OmpA family protein [Nonlabens ulvanivorans]|uniref:OmpA family protein n=2 Tax=Nonlabens ulvanivorans TaxID=906888 RepID=UPI003266B0FB